MNKLFAELRRRNVFRVAGVYAVIGWLLIQVIVAIKTPLHLPEWTDTFFVVLVLAGFPVALILAWAFEVTPEGVKLTKDVAEGESIAAKTGRKLDYAILAGLTLVVVTIVANRLMPEKTTAIAIDDSNAVAAPSDASIAVLPFEDLSPQGDQGYFADGMAEEVLNVLANVPGLSVASRTSSFQFKGREIGVPEIAKQLNVRHVLEGSVRKAGTTVRITAQLIDTKTDRHLWSQTFDRPLTTDDVFTIQDQIAQAIVNAMDKLIGVAAAPKVTVAPATDNLTAYDLYLQARPMVQARANLVQADALLARAVEQDPKFVKAWELRASIYTVISDWGQSNATPEKDRERALKYVERALEIDPNSAAAIAVRANVWTTESELLAKPHSYSTIIDDLEKSLTLDPHNANTLNWLGIAKADVGDIDGALQSFEKCLSYEPYHAACIGNQLTILGELGRDKEALEIWKRDLDAGRSDVRVAPFAVLARLGEELAFMAGINGESNLYRYPRQDDIYRAMRSATPDKALAADLVSYARSRPSLPETQISPFGLAIGAYDMPPGGFFVWDAAYADYRHSPQFKNWLQKSGVEKYWRDHGFPPQCKPLGKDDFECK